VEEDEEFLVLDDFMAPGGAVKFLQGVEFFVREIEDLSIPCPRSRAPQPMGVSRA